MRKVKVKNKRPDVTIIDHIRVMKELDFSDLYIAAKIGRSVSYVQKRLHQDKMRGVGIYKKKEA